MLSRYAPPASLFTLRLKASVTRGAKTGCSDGGEEDKEGKGQNGGGGAGSGRGNGEREAEKREGTQERV